ncbi:MAG: response regulator [Rhodospirillales bacterium]|nr:response regulator [Rhodospirillales bacterium]
MNHKNNITSPISFDAQVLVAEDEEVNRMVARGIMVPLGIEPDFAENGAEAVEKTATQRYDLILMDVQMPEMDGLEATAQIRQRERADGRSPTPIVALTAFAAKGDRQRCLDAGMDDYITKPLMRDNLIVTFERWLGDQTGQPEQQRQGQSQVQIQDIARGPLDATGFTALTQSMQSVLGDLASVLESYLESLQRLPAAIGQAVADDDAEALARAAHSLKSNSAAAAALELSALSGNLEELARKGDMAGIEATFLRKKNEIVRVKVAIEAELDGLSR